jgi:hypothetical protein
MLPRALRAFCVLSLVLILAPAALPGQTAREALDQLFLFGGSVDPFFLAGSASTAGTAAHGQHFIPSQSETNGALLEFFNTAIATQISSFPLSSTVSSETFRFVEGVPTPTSTSFGPIFAERAQTIGRGRLKAGANYSHTGFSEIRGVSLSDVQMTFVHVNSDFAGCDTIFNDDCSKYGVPQVENDLIDLSLDLEMGADVFAFFATFGVTDWLDLSVAVPVVNFQMRGTSFASIIPSTPDSAFHFFGGTPQDPVLQATNTTDFETTGIGDIAGRLKVHLVAGENWDLGVLGEVRAPTGREEDFLGSGEWNAKGLLIMSGNFSDFSPHANVGYEYRGAEFDQDQLWIIAGFDQRLADWATLAVDLLGGFKVGEQELSFPESVTFDAPYRRTADLTNIPDRRDDTLDGSLGFKLRTSGGVIVVTNILVPLNDGGLRARPTPTLGIEYTL